MYCLRPKKIENPYSGKPVTVSCRSCECCVVERASQISQKIINHINFLPKGVNTYFVTLTYSNEFVPNIRPKMDQYGKFYFDSLPEIYRGFSDEVLPYSTEDLKKHTYVEDTINYYLNQDVFYLPAYHKKAIAVLWYQDHTLFLKRLRKYLYSHGYPTNFSYYCSAELGETTYRPHYHYLISTPVSEEVFKTAIMSTWTYCDYNKLSSKWFELASCPAHYLGSYVCDGFSLPLFYKLPLWRQKKFHSLHYGFNNPSFEFSSFFDSVLKNELTYHTEYVDKAGNHISYDLPFPSYVRNRYFPIIKGFFRLAPYEYIYFAQNLTRMDTKPFDFFRITNSNGITFVIPQTTYDFQISTLLHKLGYDSDDVYRAWLAFERCRYYASLLDVSPEFYFYQLYSFYQKLKSFQLKQLHKDDQSFVHSFRYYTDVSDNLSDTVFTDENGCFLKDNVFTYLRIFKPSRQSDLLRKFSENKNIKKIKAESLGFYGQKSNYYNLAYGT